MEKVYDKLKFIQHANEQILENNQPSFGIYTCALRHPGTIL